MFPSNGSSIIPNVTEEERKRFLDQMQEAEVPKFYPTIVFLVLVATVGLFGNSLVLLVYSRKARRGATDVFIMAIASFDLLTNVVGTPAALHNFFHLFELNSSFLCRGRLYFNGLTTVSSTLLLLAVAVCRYKKVCKPFGRQISVRTAKISCFVIAIVSGILLAPQAAIHDSQTIPTKRPGIYAQVCFIDQEIKKTIWPFLYTMLLMLMFLGILVPLITLYTLISIQAWRHSKRHGIPMISKTPTASEALSTESKDSNDKRNGKSLVSRGLGFLKRIKNNGHALSPTERSCSGKGAKHGDSGEVEMNKKTSKSDDVENHELGAHGTHAESSIEDKDFFTDPQTISSANAYQEGDEGTDHATSEQLSKRSDVAMNNQIEPKTIDTFGPTNSKSNTLKSKSSIKRNTRSQRRVLTRTTLMMIIISAVFVVSILPHLVIISCVMAIPSFFDDIKTVSGHATYHIFLRFYFINSAANAIIYGLCDARFRAEVVKIFNCRKRVYF